MNKYYKSAALEIAIFFAIGIGVHLLIKLIEG